MLTIYLSYKILLNFLCVHKLSTEVVSYIDVLCPTIKNWILSHCHCRHVITKENCWLLVFTCISSKIFLSHISSQVALVAATYSASVEDNPTVACFFDDQYITLDPNWNMYPFVLFRSFIHPPQSLSVYPISLYSFFTSYKISYVFIPLMYCRMLLAAVKRTLLGIIALLKDKDLSLVLLYLHAKKVFY